MNDLADAQRLPVSRAEPPRRNPEERSYAGPRTHMALDWLDALEVAHGAPARAGAELLLASIDTRRFQLTLTPGAIGLAVSFHAGGRRTVAAQLRRDNALVELTLDDLAEAGACRTPQRLGNRLEAVAPASFRWSRADGSLPGLALAACANEGIAERVAALLDEIVVSALRAVAVKARCREPRD